jgi:hypothetical protein
MEHHRHPPTLSPHPILSPVRVVCSPTHITTNQPTNRSTRAQLSLGFLVRRDAATARYPLCDVSAGQATRQRGANFCANVGAICDSPQHRVVHAHAWRVGVFASHHWSQRKRRFLHYFSGRLFDSVYGVHSSFCQRRTHSRKARFQAEDNARACVRIQQVSEPRVALTVALTLLSRQFCPQWSIAQVLALLLSPYSSTHPPTNPPTQPTYQPTYQPVHSPTHRPTHSPTHPFTRSPTHPLTHSPAHPLTHSPTHSMNAD